MSARGEIIALSVTGFVGLLALCLAILALLKLRTVRSDQRVVLGEDKRDLVAHASSLQQQFEQLNRYMEEVATSSRTQMQATAERLDHAITNCALVRYDAYGEQSGHQSTSIALLDDRKTGVILSSIVHRDHARLYSKLIDQGNPERELSPEEQEALELALESKQAMASVVT